MERPVAQGDQALPFGHPPSAGGCSQADVSIRQRLEGNPLPISFRQGIPTPKESALRLREEPITQDAGLVEHEDRRIAHALPPIVGEGGSDWAYSCVAVVSPVVGGVWDTVCYRLVAS
jgi:hypothetical protein